MKDREFDTVIRKGHYPSLLHYLRLKENGPPARDLYLQRAGREPALCYRPCSICDRLNAPNALLRLL